MSQVRLLYARPVFHNLQAFLASSYARLTQWLEYFLYTEGVGSSNLSSSTNNAGYSSGELNGLISRSGGFNSLTRNQFFTDYETNVTLET